MTVEPCRKMVGTDRQPSSQTIISSLTQVISGLISTRLIALFCWCRSRPRAHARRSVAARSRPWLRTCHSSMSSTSFLDAVVHLIDGFGHPYAGADRETEERAAGHGIKTQREIGHGTTRGPLKQRQSATPGNFHCDGWSLASRIKRSMRRFPAGNVKSREGNLSTGTSETVSTDQRCRPKRAGRQVRVQATTTVRASLASGADGGAVGDAATEPRSATILFRATKGDGTTGGQAGAHQRIGAQCA